MKQKLLLICGILSSLFYIAVNIIVAAAYPGYNAASQTVSELSAIGSPTRSLWVTLMPIYSILTICFGIGIYRSGSKNKFLRLIGILLIGEVLIGSFWPPMHTREVLAAGGGTISDTLHIVFTFITVPLMLLVMAFAAYVFRSWFRFYSIFTIVVLLTTGILTGLTAGDMEANLPTPWMGIWERIGIAAHMIWILVFAIRLMKEGLTKKIYSEFKMAA